LEEAENTAKNLSAVLVGLSVEAGETIKRVSILTGQLEKASLFLILLREEKVTGIIGNEYIIYRLIVSRTRSHVI
jgi:hypothetical protein